MKVIHHGVWERYTPEKKPDDMPEGVMYCRRRKDGKDWYDLLRKDKPFSSLTIKMTVMDGIVQAANRDPERLFPQGCGLIEVEGDDVSDPQKKYGQMRFDGRSFTPAPPPPPPGPTIDDLIAQLKEQRALIAELKEKLDGRNG